MFLDLQKVALLKVSPVHRFLVGKWPIRIWLGGATLGTTILCFSMAGFGLRSISIDCIGYYLLILVLAPPFGFLLGVITAAMVFPSIMSTLARVNGGPFRKGDQVQIIGGPHDGKRTHVLGDQKPRAGGMDGGTVEVDLGDEHGLGVNILDAGRLLRVTDTDSDPPTSGTAE